jgi:hypothetical protein
MAASLIKLLKKSGQKVDQHLATLLRDYEAGQVAEAPLNGAQPSAVDVGFDAGSSDEDGDDEASLPVAIPAAKKSKSRAGNMASFGSGDL